MKSSYLVALMTAALLALSGCGSSSSDNNNNKDLDADEALLQFCLEFPDARDCEFISGEAADLGFFDYYGGGNDFFSDSAFGNSGIGCGCRRGTRGVLYRGVRRCESEIIFNSLRGHDVGILFRRRANGKTSAWVSFGSSTDTIDRQSSISFGTRSCYEMFSVRCNLNRGNRYCRGIRNRRGKRIRATCEPINGHNVRWGYCQPL